MIAIVIVTGISLDKEKRCSEQFNKFGGAKVILATVPSEKAMSEILEGLAVNGKIVIIGASNEPKVHSIQGRRSLLGWPASTSIDSQDTYYLVFSLVSGQ